MIIGNDALISELEALKNNHEKLDATIACLTRHTPIDHMNVQRLKKTKLRLKDKIARLESMLFPDIIA